MTEVREGGCRCGAVRFAVSAPAMLTIACHCTGCQRMTGGAYALSVAVPTAGFEVTAGEPVVGGLRGQVAHHHCPQCMSWVFTRPPGLPFVNVRTTMLDRPQDFPPYLDIWVSEKLPWVTPTSAHAFDQFPAPEEWPALMQAYAAERPA